MEILYIPNWVRSLKFKTYNCIYHDTLYCISSIKTCCNHLMQFVCGYCISSNCQMVLESNHSYVSAHAPCCLSGPRNIKLYSHQLVLRALNGLLGKMTVSRYFPNNAKFRFFPKLIHLVVVSMGPYPWLLLNIVRRLYRWGCYFSHIYKTPYNVYPYLSQSVLHTLYTHA